MSATNRTDLARDVFEAFAAGDRERIESLLAPSLSFHAPPDPYLDRAGYFEGCWPGSGSENTFDFARIIEAMSCRHVRRNTQGWFPVPEHGSAHLRGRPGCRDRGLFRLEPHVAAAASGRFGGNSTAVPASGLRRHSLSP